MIIAVPVVFGLLLGVALLGEWVIPGCSLGLVGIEQDICMVADIDLAVPFALMAFPFFISAFLIVPYAVLLAPWLAVGVIGAVLGALRP